jgi:1,4-alpha-glucan branching enzyme
MKTKRNRKNEGRAPARTSRPPNVEPVVHFSVEDRLATRVHVAGDFNGWDPSALALTRNADGIWSAPVTLKPGTYEYLFIADGVWRTDPDARKVPNPYGSMNSVITVADPNEPAGIQVQSRGSTLEPCREFDSCFFR